MPIIIISSDSRDMEKELAEKIAGELGYSLLTPQFLADVAAKHQIVPDKLNEALESRPSLIQKMSARRRRYHLSCIEAEVFERFRQDNTVCWGLAAHLYVFGVSHVLKVRILSSDGEVDKNQKSLLQKTGKRPAIEKQRQRKWSVETFGHDETDPSLFDLVINLDQIDSGEAIETITGAVRYRKFQPMTYSIKYLSDQALAARARVELMKSMTNIDVEAHDGGVIVFIKAFGWEKRKKTQAIKEIVGKMDGVMYVEVHVKKAMTTDGNAN